MIRCTNCGDQLRDAAKFCDNCGARIEIESAKGPQVLQVATTGGESVTSGGDGDVFDWADSTDSGETTPETNPEDGDGSFKIEPLAEGDGAADAEEAAEAPTDADSEGMEPVSLGPDASSDEGEDASESPEAEAETPAAEEAKGGYLIFPDTVEQPIPPSQWLIGRADLAKYLADPDKANEISRGHFTIFQEGDHFFVEDGHTMVQEKASANKTWLVRAGSRILVTGTGRNELQDGDDIDVAELVRLQFTMK
jgi:hypothetical protein